MAEDWKTDVIAGVERWNVVAGGGSRAAWYDLGAAAPRDDGWLVLDLRDRRVANTFLDPCFAGGQGPERERAHPVEELRSENGVLLLWPPPGLPEHSRHLWVRPVPEVAGLLDGLRAAGPAPLAQALAERRPAGSPTSRAEPDGLLDAQVEAYRACLSPGVRLVWGPPGTGKTYVLARAIEALVDEGKRVLLVSASNIAVGDVLHAVVRRMSPQAGIVVRVGQEIAGDPGVRLERLAARESRAADEERASIAAELLEMEQGDAEVERLRAELGDFDEPAYRAAAARLAAERDLDALRPRQQEAEAAADLARRAVVTTATELRKALDAQVALAPVRDALEHERRAIEGLAALAERQRALQQSRAALLAQESAGWRGRRQHRRQVLAAEAELHRFTAAAADGRRRWLDVQLQARAVIGEHSRSDVDKADERAANAENAVTTADETYRRVRERLVALRGAIDEAEARGVPTDEDRRLVADVEARGLPASHARLRELAGRQDGAVAQALDNRHRELVERSRELRADAEARIVQEARVVATTVARSRIHPALVQASFDVVLVDGAGAAPLAEILLVLCRATTTAVLFGDFLQLGPVLDSAMSDDASPALQRWVRATCFSHLGIESPADADAHDGCVALTHQFRFGAALRRLANEALYEQLRDAAEVQTDIVLIDVSTVPDLAAVRLGAVDGKWTTAGAVLSRALAERHAPDGPVGVVAPDAAQAAVTLAAFRDRAMIAGVAVGTVHALQGRAFPTAVVDLVAGDGGPRTFGAGITLARDRLYVIADATAGGPLRDAVERGEVRTWSAAALLGMAEPPTGDTTFAEVSELLRQQVTVNGLGLERRIAAAQRTVWMWTPWSADVVPLLRTAAGRGVRVRVFARPDEDIPLAPVIRSDHEHGQLAVVDEHVVLLGSGKTAITVVGREFAGRLLAELQAEWTGEPRECSRCGETMEVWRGGTADVQWQCPNCRIRIPEQRDSSLRTPAPERS